MTEEMVLVVGLCEVGHTLFELLKENERFAVYGFDSDRESARAERSKVGYSYDFRRGYKHYSVNPAKFLNLLKDLALELIFGAILGPSLRFSPKKSTFLKPLFATEMLVVL